jgi:hypothetical protein
VNENIEATGFSKVSKDTFDVYPWDAFGPPMVAVGDCVITDGGSTVTDAERLLDTEGLAAGIGEFSVLTVLWTGDAVGRTGICGTGGIGEG